MTRDATALRQLVVDAIAEVAPDADVGTLGDDDEIVPTLELDSMDVLDVCAGIYERTGIDIPERDYPKLVTLAEFTTYLTAREDS